MYNENLNNEYSLVRKEEKPMNISLILSDSIKLVRKKVLPYI